MLTVEQQATNFETMRHIERVRNLLNVMVVELLRRGQAHDQSKLGSPEVEILAENTECLKTMTYMSPEYRAQLQRPAMRVYLDHHYANNAHHPQHHKHGVNDMTLVDLLEMIVDWKAAGERHHDGNILKSIEDNAERFEMSPQLRRIFENTAKQFLESK